ncbi:MAG: DUF3560 domain-containing protein [Candidatus Thorarchaeota archaeon]
MTLERDRSKKSKRGLSPKEIHRRRSKRAQSVDEALQAKTAPSTEVWAKDPARSDIPGVDTPAANKQTSPGRSQKKKSTVSKTPKFNRKLLRSLSERTETDILVTHKTLNLKGKPVSEIYSTLVLNGKHQAAAELARVSGYEPPEHVEPVTTWQQQQIAKQKQHQKDYDTRYEEYLEKTKSKNPMSRSAFHTVYVKDIHDLDEILAREATQEKSEKRTGPTSKSEIEYAKWLYDPERKSSSLQILHAEDKPFWRVNHETQRVEVIYPDKPEPEERQKLKGKGFRWSPKRGAWVRKITSTSMTKAQSLGFERAEDVGTPLTGGEKAQRELERMERSAERHEARSKRAMFEAKQHHKEAKQMMDVIPMGQPILVGHHSERADRRYRERIHKKEGKFVEKYRESEHEQNVAERVARRAKYMKENPAYASKKIEALDKEIRGIDRRLETEYDPIYASSRQEFDEWKEGLRARRKEATEERVFWAEHLKSIGGIKYSKSNVKKGDMIRYRNLGWYRVVRVNPKSVTIEWRIGGLETTRTVPYREIRELKEENTE